MKKSIEEKMVEKLANQFEDHEIEQIMKLIKKITLQEFIALKGYIWSDNDFNGNDLYKDKNGQEFDLTEIINREIEK